MEMVNADQKNCAFNIPSLTEISSYNKGLDQSKSDTVHLFLLGALIQKSNAPYITYYMKMRSRMIASIDSALDHDFR